MSTEEKEQIEHLHNQLNDLQIKTTKMLFYLESDPSTNQKGLVERQGLIEDTLDKLLSREEIYKGKGTVWGIVGGAILTVIIFIGKMVFAKIM